MVPHRQSQVHHRRRWFKPALASSGPGLHSLQLVGAGAARPRQFGGNSNLVNAGGGSSVWFVARRASGARAQGPPRWHLGFARVRSIHASQPHCARSSCGPCATDRVRCLTLRSRRPTTACHPGRTVQLFILHCAARASCRCGRLSSNVRCGNCPLLSLSRFRCWRAGFESWVCRSARQVGYLAGKAS